jgi:hypothetical protein
MRGKKASFELGGIYVDFWAYLVWVLVIIVFILAFTLKSCSDGAAENKILKEAKSSLEPNIILMNYLRTPVIVHGKEMNMADLIVIRIEDSNYDHQLRQESEKILTPLYQAPYFWGIKVFDERNSQLLKFYQQGYSLTLFYTNISISKQKIPYQKGTGYYVVEFTKWED